MSRQKIIIASHISFYDKGDIHGPPHAISEYLFERKVPHVFIKHPLSSGRKSEVVFFDPKRKRMKSIGLGKNLPLFIQYLSEIFLTIKETWNLKENNKIFIGVDPLNALAGLILKRIGKVQKLVSFTPDYSPQRFKNLLINWAYHRIDQLTVKQADFAWVVSSRILERRREQGVSEEKLFLIPNSPPFKKIKRLPYSAIDPYKVIIVSSLVRSVNFPILLETIADLRKEFSQIKLDIIGSGGYEQELKKLVKKLKIEDKVAFLGRMTHEDVFYNLTKSAIGIAPYTTDNPWTYFCDPMKVRDYLACGLPVIMTNVPAVAKEIDKRKAGIIIKLKKSALKKAIRKLLKDRNLYQKYRKNAIKMAKDYDLDKILDKAFAKLRL